MVDFSVGPYTVRFSNPNVPVRDDNRYSKLNSVGRHDSYALFKSYFESYSKEFLVKDESKVVYRFSDLVFLENERKIFGFFCVGTYGSLSQIIDVESGKVDFTKATKHAEIIKYFFCVRLPVNADEGVILIQSIRGKGVKTLLHGLLSSYVDRNCKHNLQMNPLSYEQSFEQWKDSIAREIVLVKFNPVKDHADALNMLGHEEMQTDLVVKVNKKANLGLGTYRDFLDSNSSQSRAVEVLMTQCANVKAVFVDDSGRSRTFSVAHSSRHPICEIDVPESVTLVDGNVEFDSMKGWCNDVLNEFSNQIIRKV